MKKLSLLLFAFCVSVAMWANADDPYQLNPYAYDLWSSWDEATQKLKLRFKVNSVPNLEDVNGWACGIQVYAVDSRGGTYYIWGTPGDTIRKVHNGGAGAYEYVADLSSGLDLHGNLIPRNEDLTWKVRVAGRGNGNTTKYTPEGTKSDAGIDYTRVRYWASLTSIFQNNRFVPQSIAINTNPESRNFGRVIIADNNNHGTTWYSSWKNGNTRGRGIYGIEPDYRTVSNDGKRASLDNSVELGGFNSDQKEPRGVCVSDDGRIFVSSYSNNSSVAVWELSNSNDYASSANRNAYAANKLKLNTLTDILDKSKISNYRVVSIDVMGVGNDLKLLLLCSSTSTNKVSACYEYKVSTEELTSIPLHNDIKSYAYEDDGINIHAKISYGKTKQDKKIDNIIWIGFSSSSKNESRLYAVDRNGNIKENEKFGDRLGGEGFFVKGNMLIKSYRNYKNTAGTTSTEDNPYSAGVLIKKIADDGYTIVMDDHYFDNDSYIWNAELGQGYSGSICAKVINDIAVDYANNVYLISIYTGRNFPISLPYSGIMDTPAPSNQKFRLRDAVPNIMAMDLNCVPHGNSPSYEFSFLTNTKPTHAEIRFYRKEKSANMISNIQTIHADDYDKTKHSTKEPDYVYTFPQNALKQGKMSVILNMVGGKRDVQTITNALPPGELYWTVYVETEKSTCFAPIYRQPYKRDPHYRLHAVVNNYPETDQFGWLYAANYRGGLSDNNSIMVYKFSEDGKVDDLNSNNVHNSTRYELAIEYMNSSFTKGDTKLNNQRRMIVAPDGKLFIADEGTHNASEILPGTLPIFAENADGKTPTYQYGGIKVWDPKTPDKLTLFSNNKLNSSSAVTLYKHNDVGWRLYATNTYNEYAKHNKSKDEGYTKEEQAGIYGWNGFVRYENLTVNDKGIFSWTGNTYASTAKTEYALGRGDASGNMSIIAIDKGIWMCQHREHTYNIKYNLKEPLADNVEAYVLSFVPYGSSERTWKSSTTLGVQWSSGTAKVEEPVSEISQKATGKLQSTPGAGMAYKALRNASGNILHEYLYVVNHDGNIAKFEITWKDSKTPILSDDKNANIEILETPGNTKGDIRAEKANFTPPVPQVWHTAAISSMNFDYAGNLVTTTGVAYFDMNLMNNERDTMPEGAQNIIVYTMPYDRTNAQEIRASDDRILIPERLAQFDMTNQDIKDILDDHIEHQTGTCAIDLYRPMQGSMFNTICLPFDLKLSDIPTGVKHPLEGVEIKQFKGVSLDIIGGENILTLQFDDVENGIMKANIPHIIKPVNNIKGIMELDWGIPLTKDVEITCPKYNFDNGNTITYQGILPLTNVKTKYDLTTNLPLRLILVADNRLAAITSDGDMYGFRGYFDLAKSLPSGTKINISARKDTPTNTTIVVDGKKVNIEKYLREGRVYIRVGDSLYTIDGQVVE